MNNYKSQSNCEYVCSCKLVCGVPKVPGLPTVNIGPFKASEPGSITSTPPVTATCGLCEYGYIYNLQEQTVAVEADILFDSNGIMTSGITHAPGTSQIIVTTPGVYEIFVIVATTEPAQFALVINGSVVPGSVYGSGAGTQQDSGQGIVTLAAGDVLTIRNHTSAAAVGLATFVGGTQANVNASILIKMLSSNV